MVYQRVLEKKTYWSGVSQKLAGVLRICIAKGCIVKAVSQRVYHKGCIAKVYHEGCIMKGVSQKVVSQRVYCEGVL